MDSKQNKVSKIVPDVNKLLDFTTSTSPKYKDELEIVCNLFNTEHEKVSYRDIGGVKNISDFIDKLIMDVPFILDTVSGKYLPDKSHPSARKSKPQNKSLIKIKQTSNTKMEKTKEEKPNGIYISDDKWGAILYGIEQNKNILMLGPSGTGKTKISKIAAGVKNKKLFTFNMGSTQDPKVTLIGQTQLNKDGTFFSESKFIKAIQTENSVILLDELSRAHPEAWNILLPLLDQEQRIIYIDENDENNIVKLADGVVFIATANIGSEYTATKIMDRALIDRFPLLIEFDYLSRFDEKNLLIERVGVTEFDANNLTLISSEIRHLKKVGKITTDLSTRSLIEAASLVKYGFSLKTAIDSSIGPMFGPIEDPDRVILNATAQKYDTTQFNNQNLL